MQGRFSWKAKNLQNRLYTRSWTDRGKCSIDFVIRVVGEFPSCFLSSRSLPCPLYDGKMGNRQVFNLRLEGYFISQQLQSPGKNIVKYNKNEKFNSKLPLCPDGNSNEKQRKKNDEGVLQHTWENPRPTKIANKQEA